MSRNLDYTNENWRKIAADFWVLAWLMSVVCTNEFIKMSGR